MNEQENKSFEEEYFVTHISFTISDRDVRDNVSRLDPESITTELGIQPSWSFKGGDTFLSRTPDGRGGYVLVEHQRPWTVWGLRTDQLVESNELDHHCRVLLDLLEPRRAVLEKYLGQPDVYHVGIKIRTEQSGWIISYGLSSELLIRLSNLCHDIGFSNICYGDDAPREIKAERNRQKRT